MEIEQTPLPGVLLIKPKVWGDARGWFVETWQRDRYAEAGIDLPFVQDNHSCSAHGTLRGLHFQKTFPQGKLVSAPVGRVLDVVVDIRPESAAFGQWYSTELNAENQHQLWVPPGLAHGFVVLSEMAHFHYKCTEFYHPEDEGCIRFDDADLNIAWPKIPYILSSKDKSAPSFADWNFLSKKNA